ncbi:MAG: CBS domain-containing protein [Methanosphaera sp.]|uniref:CBS domain-containing protein n=1 Tax=Methanosphaera sp. TaxID=2666342 RepID=UPI0025E2E768|nr:CBS domain-containing protein [Methanosphaera sp.]MCI5867331.1 CBS domain-containing protein [Methanosphaera sp.]MDD6534601.1 CBS domain-containing protein [Methanosphaera sp.]MDY3955731.1 CBS domain-containing protein [Methanosphaera sp.]
MIIKDVMNNTIYSIKSNEKVREAIRLLQEYNINRLFVVNDNDSIIGSIGYIDLFEIIKPAEKLNIDDISVSELMDVNINFIDVNEVVENAANLILRSETSALIVTEDNKNVGVITKTDICRCVAMSKLIGK